MSKYNNKAIALLLYFFFSPTSIIKAIAVLLEVLEVKEKNKKPLNKKLEGQNTYAYCFRYKSNFAFL